MKSSFYNLYIDTQNNEHIMFNSFTTGMTIIDSETAELLMNNNIEILSNAPKLYEQLQKEGYILPDYIDELCMLRHTYELDKYNNGIFTLTVAPTMNCNLACKYCFEQDSRVEDCCLMSEEIQDKLVEYIRIVSNNVKGFHIVWFGGEPLLGISVIDRLSSQIRKIANDRNLSYAASITTNGILISKNPNIIDSLTKNEINDLQITLDGDYIEHDERRRYKHSGKGTFYEIVETIELLKNSSIRTSIRINVDLENHKTFENLFNTLKEKNLLDLHISFGHLRNYCNSCNVGICYPTVQQFCDIHTQIYSILNKIRNRDDDLFNYPELAKPCVANRESALVIDDKGYIYKCRTLIGNVSQATGNIEDLSDVSLKAGMDLSKWVAWSPFEYEQCRKCKILPLCMGGCIYNCLINSNIPECNEWKYYLEHYLLEIYNAMIKNKSS